jgi:hypothetical protein
LTGEGGKRNERQRRDASCHPVAWGRRMSSEHAGLRLAPPGQTG